VDDVVEGIFRLMKSPETLPMNVGLKVCFAGLRHVLGLGVL